MLSDNHNSTNDTAGSDKIEPAFVLVGKFQRTHGVGGEITMRVDTDFPERIRRGRVLYTGEAYLPLKVQRARWKGKLLLIKFVDFDSPEDVSEFTNQFVFASIIDLPPLPEGEYYHHQLIGLDVYEGAEHLGRLSAILETGANDVYIIEDGDGNELLLPAIPSVIQQIDLKNNRMDVQLIEGLR